MKVRSFRAPRFLLAAVAQGRTVLRGARHLALEAWPVCILAAIGAILLAFLLFPHDAPLLAWLHSSAFAQAASTTRIAAFLGTWGDYPTYNLPLSLGLWAYGSWSKNHAWRRIAIVCFLGGTLAGLFDDCFRLTLGRPRPDAHLPDGFYGFKSAWHARFQSFPSGHAAAVFGTATSLLIVRRSLGLITTIFALFVVWARMELYRHYPSDVVVGSIIGISFGLLVGAGATIRHPPRPARSLPP